MKPKIAVLLGAAAFAASLSCSREPCQRLDRYWGSPEAWRRHEREPRPRCAANDPSCGPEPALALALGEGCYHPSAKREPLPPGQGRRTEFACGHDGECQLAGCGNACVHYRARDFTTTCIGYDWLDENAFCGCVEGACSFFRQ